MHAYLNFLRILDLKVRKGEITRDEGRLHLDSWVNQNMPYLAREPIEIETY
jgi:hypothetical protein